MVIEIVSFPIKKWWCSIVMSIYQRVSNMIKHISNLLGDFSPSEHHQSQLGVLSPRYANINMFQTTVDFDLNRIQKILLFFGTPGPVAYLSKTSATEKWERAQRDSVVQTGCHPSPDWSSAHSSTNDQRWDIPRSHSDWPCADPNCSDGISIAKYSYRIMV